MESVIGLPDNDTLNNAPLKGGGEDADSVSEHPRKESICMFGQENGVSQAKSSHSMDST